MRSTWKILAVVFSLLALNLALGAHSEISAPSGDHEHVAVHEGEELTGHDAHAHDEHGEHHGLTPDALVIHEKVPITSSMVVTWIVALGIIFFARKGMRNAQPVPSGLQNFVEMLVEALYDFFEEIVGSHMIRKTFWFFSTIFIFVVFANWFGLLPGVGTVGFGTIDAETNEFVLKYPLFRGANADLNMTLAMALAFFVLWAYWSVNEIGAGGMTSHVFQVKGHGVGPMAWFLVFVFICVGVIEIVSICIRPVALTFRLYGNVFAGENILETIIHMGGPIFGGIIVLPFYMLELLVGLVQGLVFALLTAVFTGLMCEHHDDHGDDGGEAHAH